MKMRINTLNTIHFVTHTLKHCIGCWSPTLDVDRPSSPSSCCKAWHSVRPSLHRVSPCPRTSTQHATDQTSNTRTDKRRARLLSDKCQALIPARLSFFSPHIKNPSSAFCLCLSHGGPHLPSLSLALLPASPPDPGSIVKGLPGPGQSGIKYSADSSHLH